MSYDQTILNEHITIGQKYRIKFEKAASANKIDGFSVEANDDDYTTAYNHASALYLLAIAQVEAHKPLVPPVVKEGK